MAIFVGLIPQFHYVKKCKYLKIMVWGPTSRASAKSTKLFDRLKPMNSYRVISQLTYEKEKNQFWELFKNGQCPLATPSQPTVCCSFTDHNTAGVLIWVHGLVQPGLILVILQSLSVAWAFEPLDFLTHHRKSTFL